VTHQNGAGAPELCRLRTKMVQAVQACKALVYIAGGEGFGAGLRWCRL